MIVNLISLSVNTKTYTIYELNLTFNKRKKEFVILRRPTIYTNCDKAIHNFVNLTFENKPVDIIQCTTSIFTYLNDAQMKNKEIFSFVDLNKMLHVINVKDEFTKIPHKIITCRFHERNNCKFYLLLKNLCNRKFKIIYNVT